MHLVYGIDDPVREFIEAGIPRCRERGLPRNGVAIGVADDSNTIIGGMWFHDYDPDAGVIEISGSSIDKRWLTRKTLHGLFSYPFEGLGCQLVAMKHSVRDKPLARMLRAYGFQQVIIPRLFGRYEDAIVSTLTAEDWKNNGFHKDTV